MEGFESFTSPIVVRDMVDKFAVETVDRAPVPITQPPRALCYGVEHRLCVGGRPTDDAEDLTGCGLVFERLLQFALARLLRLEQPGVLDGDHRLVRKVFEQRDLLVAEEPDFGASD